MKAPIDGFWGKLSEDRSAWHPLIDHCADVAACCEALLSTTLLRKRLARLGGLDDLDEVMIARLAAIAALHDVGKFNTGFQNKGFDQTPKCGHVREVLALVENGNKLRDRLFEAIPTSDLLSWGQDEVALHLLIAAICHHGRPYSLQNVGVSQNSWWEPRRHLDPFAGIAKLSEAARRWFPQAFAEHNAELPVSPAFQHGFSGLVMLADWLGSDTKFFSYSDAGNPDRMTEARRFALRAVRETYIDTSRCRVTLGAVPITFERFVPDKIPRRIQSEMLSLPNQHQGSLVLLEAETGSGKTEAAVARFLRLFQDGYVDGMYFALPTRTAATQIHARIVDAISHAFPDQNSQPPVILAVPGYIAVDDRTGHYRLPGFEVLWNDDPAQRYRYRGWAAEGPKRYLAGSIAVGTIDQALLSALQVNHSHMRATCLLRNLLIVDEVHASDTYMTRILAAVLRNHVAGACQ